MSYRTLCIGLVGMIALAVSEPLAIADEGSCDAEAKAVAGLKERDPSLAPPTNKEAADRMTEGNRHHRVQQYDEAIKEYVAGALLDGAPVFLYNLGQSYRLAGEYEKAIRQYRLFLDRGGPGPELRALVECHISMMSAELEKAASSEQPTGPAPENPVDGGAPAQVDEHVDASPPVAPWYADPIGWGLAGGGAAVLGVGIGLFFNAASLEDDALAEDREAVRLELRDKADGRRTWGTVATIVGAASLVAGVVKLVISPTPRAERGAGLSLLISPSEIALAGTF